MFAGAVLLTQWMNPCRAIQHEDIGAQLDNIAGMVATELVQGQPGKVGKDDDQSSAPKCSRLDVRQARAVEAPVEQVLDAINTVLYDRLGFKPASIDHYYDLENSYVDKVRPCVSFNGCELHTKPSSLRMCTRNTSICFGYILSFEITL